MFLVSDIKPTYRVLVFSCFFFQAEDGIRDLVRSRGLGDVYKRQAVPALELRQQTRQVGIRIGVGLGLREVVAGHGLALSLIHI